MKENLIYKDKNNNKIIYDRVIGDSDGDDVILFLGGLWSDRKGTKASFLQQYCLEKKYSFIRFDYLGHGDSDLNFIDCGIDDWLENALEIIENLIKGKVILIGSSLGGWLALNVVKRIPHKIKALITFAAAPDFTEELMSVELNKKQKDLINSQGFCNYVYEDSGDKYQISKKLLISGKNNLILPDLDKLKINFPVRIFHGMKDEDVPCQYSIKIAENLKADDLLITLIKDGDHSLSRDQDLNMIMQSVEDVFQGA